MGVPSALVPGWHFIHAICEIDTFVNASKPPFALLYQVAFPNRVACRLVRNVSSIERVGSVLLSPPHPCNIPTEATTATVRVTAPNAFSLFMVASSFHYTLAFRSVH